ncbi:MAG: J domain-containing protein [Treponema sp.]|jgi:DnaJ-domain-containing protein 1|nr:J domain-containing protein [Treponema sp.]
MGIIDRLGDVIRSYLNDEAEEPWEDSFQSRKQNRRQPWEDADMKAAFEELDEYLQRKPGKKEGSSFGAGTFRAQNTARGSTASEFKRHEPASAVPESLRQDFAELGVSMGASPEACKAAYKKLLKIHHPDRHAGHPGNMKKATEKSARLNTAFDRIERWRQTGKVE